MTSLNRNEKVEKLIDLKKSTSSIEEIKRQINDILGDTTLEEKMVISDEVREKANHQDWNELQKLHFIVPYIISEFIDMTDEEKAKFLAKPKTNPIVENPDPIVENPNPVVGKPSDDDKSDSDDDKPDGDGNVDLPDNINFDLGPIKTCEEDSDVEVIDNNKTTENLGKGNDEFIEDAEIIENAEIIEEDGDRINKLNSKLNGLGKIKKISLKRSDYLKGKNKVIIDDSGKEILHINGDNLSETLYTVDESTLFVGKDGRWFVIAKIGKDSYLPFYRSSEGTSGKEQGSRYPFFGRVEGENDWVVKGSTENMKNGYNITKIKKISDRLNQNLKFEDCLLNGIKMKKGNEIFNLNDFIKSKFKGNDDSYKSMSDIEFMNRISGFYPNQNKIKHPDNGKTDEEKQARNDWISNILKDIKENESD